MDQLRVCMFNQQVDILAINETKLNADVPQDLISFEGTPGSLEIETGQVVVLVSS